MIPAFVKSGGLPEAFLQDGPWGVALLRPEHLFGLTGFDPVSHAVFWTMLFNVGFYLLGSLYFESSAEEQHLAKEFVTVLRSEAISVYPISREAFIDLPVKSRDRESAQPVFYRGQGQRDYRAMSEGTSY
jgi:hypothetical protein